MWFQRRRDRERDLERELRDHLDLEAAAQEEEGVSTRQSHYAAHCAFGNQTLVKEDIRSMSYWTSLEVLGKDLVCALRAIRKAPGFSAVAVVTLALGIGANTAIFSVMDAVLLRPLPYPNPQRLVRIWQSEPRMGMGRMGTAPPEFVAYRDRTRAFSSVAGYQRDSFDLTSESQPEHLPACRATASLFSVLGVAPMMGRTFSAQEELPGAAKVVVLSYQYWKNHGANPNVLGKIIRLNERGYTIIGVMPPGFSFPSTDATPEQPPVLWTPVSFTSEQLRDWASSFDTSIVARLRDGVPMSAARDDVHRVASEFQRENSNIYSGNIQLEATAEPWRADFGERLSMVLRMLGAAVGFVLIIACANVANLLLARAGARQRELSIRRALGASPARLMRQIFTETAILTLAGSALGCVLAYGLIELLATLWTGEVNLHAASIDTRVLWFTLLLSGATCVHCGLIPAWAARRPDVSDALKQSVRQSGATRGRRAVARWLIFAEIACSVVLLIGSGLLLRSFARVLQIPLGFNPEHALIVRTAFNRQRYNADRRHEVERAVVNRLSSLPGVATVALTTHVPLADQRQIGFLIDGDAPDAFHWADNALVSADYFHLMGIPLLRGRTFSEADTATSPLTAIINQGMAAEHWPRQDPVGKGFQWGGRHLTVIGVVGDLHIQALDKPVGPTIYSSVYQMESGASSSGVFILRTQGDQDPLQYSAAAQSAIWSVDRGLPILGFSTLHQVVSASLAIRRASLVLTGGFAFLALVLSLIGVYGVLSHAMAQRTQEIGVRLALGAAPSEILRLVVGEGFRLTAWGIVAGLAGGAIAATLVSKLLFGVRALDPISFAAGVTAILAVSLLASYLPARRASRLDPVIALRYE